MSKFASNDIVHASPHLSFAAGRAVRHYGHHQEDPSYELADLVRAVASAWPKLGGADVEMRPVFVTKGPLTTLVGSCLRSSLQGSLMQTWNQGVWLCQMPTIGLPRCGYFVSRISFLEDCVGQVGCCISTPRSSLTLVLREVNHLPPEIRGLQPCDDKANCLKVHKSCE